jgi:hypothetical protein
MQLLNVWTLNVVGTALIVSVLVALISTTCARGLKNSRSRRKVILLFFIPIFAFSLLGFVTGQIMGDSRQSVVGTVIPATLTLLGGVAAFIVGSKGLRTQLLISGMMSCFTFSLLVGAIFGTRLRIEFEAELEHPTRLRAQALSAEQNRFVIDIQRLENYVELLKLRRDFAEQEKLDLNRFESGYETKVETKPSGSAPDAKAAAGASAK